MLCIQSGKQRSTRLYCAATGYVSSPYPKNNFILNSRFDTTLAGCGKSILASSIIDSITSTRNVIFYYCDYADKRTLDPANVFGTLARQILEKLERIPETLASDIESADHDGERMIEQSKALDILQHACAISSSPLYIILDGLDEVREGSQKLICNAMSRLCTKSSLQIKLLVTGREELGPLFSLAPTVTFLRVPISPAIITPDIDNYVRASTRRRIKHGALVIQDPDLERLIVQELVEGAKGMLVL